MSDTNNSDLDHLVENLEKKNEQLKMVSFNDLFTSSFLTSYTEFSNFKELLDAGNFKVNSLEEFQTILNNEFDEFINKTTKFKTWEEMQKTAIDEFFKRVN